MYIVVRINNIVISYDYDNRILFVMFLICELFFIRVIYFRSDVMIQFKVEGLCLDVG